MKRRGLKPEEVAYIGDDLNDLSVGTRVGLFFVPANHHPSVRPYADYVLSSKGGHGAVREATDLILGHKGLIENLIKGFINQE
ncbi:MAG: Phosphatase kdsC [uncultured bacterium]|nr:MAG: Phosphatase kdsC [uncultured bacterium]